MAMSNTDPWLETCAENQQKLRFPAAYWLSVPFLVTGFTGLLWSLPVPAELEAISPILNWGSVFLMATVVYYFVISVPLAIGMLPVIGCLIAFETWLARRTGLLEPAAMVLTALGLAGLAVAHGGRGGPGAVFRDVQLLMIAPLYAVSRLYGRLGIPV